MNERVQDLVWCFQISVRRWPWLRQNAETIEENLVRRHFLPSANILYLVSQYASEQHDGETSIIADCSAVTVHSEQASCAKINELRSVEIVAFK